MTSRLTIQDLERLQKEGKIKGYVIGGGQPVAKKPKYGSRKTEIDAIVFDSQKEANRYIVLRYLKVKGEISELKVHVVFQLSVCKYEADFTYIKDGQLIVEDVKSKVTRKLPVYQLKKKLMANELGIAITEV